MVLQALYAGEYGSAKPEQALADLLEEVPLPDRHAQFARQLFASTMRRGDWADAHISRLAVNWDIRRIAAIDRVILRTALVELDEFPDVPVKVVLNEAIELAKKFSTRESSRFVNGILDSFVKEADSASKS